MLVVVCERDTSSSDQNLSILDTEKLFKISKDPDHDERELAQQFLDVINGKENCKNPDSYAPDDARVDKKSIEYPLTIGLCCEIWLGEY